MVATEILFNDVELRHAQGLLFESSQKRNS